MDKDTLLALADRVEQNTGELNFLEFVFNWFNAHSQDALIECILCFSHDPTETAAALRAMAGGEDA